MESEECEVEGVGWVRRVDRVQRVQGERSARGAECILGCTLRSCRYFGRGVHLLFTCCSPAVHLLFTSLVHLLPFISRSFAVHSTAFRFIAHPTSDPGMPSTTASSMLRPKSPHARWMANQERRGSSEAAVLDDENRALRKQVEELQMRLAEAAASGMKEETSTRKRKRSAATETGARTRSKASRS